MGQAKRRGTFEQRVQQAVERENAKRAERAIQDASRPKPLRSPRRAMLTAMTIGMIATSLPPSGRNEDFNHD